LQKFNLTKAEKIKSKKEIETLFKYGNTILSYSRKLKATYLIKENQHEFKTLFGVAVFKKAGSAAWRNRIRRLIREGYRKNKSILKNFCKSNRLLIYLIISPNTLNQTDSKNPSLKEIEPEVIELINKVAGSV